MATLRAVTAAALQRRREERGLSLEAVARRAGLTKGGVHSIETGRTGDFLDRLDDLATALGARWSLALISADEADHEREAIADLQAVPRELLPELRLLLQAWPSLTEDDRALMAVLAERRKKAPGELVALPGAPVARRKAT